MNYYNEYDPKAAAWLRELISAKIIPAGHVDTRSIVDVRPADLSGYTQCHFFAGIGGWSRALQLAGWPEDRPVWTGSCPCQPFSVAGKGLGVADERHLWPVFANLIRECRPPVVFGEQVASKAGREWLRGVRSDLEGMAYAVGAADLCAAGVGAPHIRQRLWWVGVGLADTCGSGLEERGKYQGTDEQSALVGGGAASGLGNAGCQCDELGRGPGDLGCAPGEEQGETRERQRGRDADSSPGADGAWSNYNLLPCRDSKSRRVESGTFPLAHGVPGRVGLLRGYGNAIVPQVAAEFIQAFLKS